MIGQSKRAYSPKQLLPAVLSSFCVALSLYYGYKAYDDLLVILDGESFDIFNGALVLDRYAHFGSFVLAVILFADFAFYELTGAHKSDHKVLAAQG